MFLETLQIMSTLVGMGADRQYDYADDEPELVARLGRCYELAALAFINLHPFAAGMPQPALLIHGKWRGPTEKEAIGHAVVVLDDLRVWEPITRAICNQQQFVGYTRFQPILQYTGQEARRLMHRTEHYGPWHESAILGG